MIHTAKAVRTLQAVAMTVGFALLLWGSGLPTSFHFAEAAAITNASDTLSNSSTSANSVHTIGFTTTNGLSIGQTIVISFPSSPGGGFNLTQLNIDDISLTVGGNPTSTAAAAGVNTWGVATGTPTGQDIQLTTPTNIGVASSTEVIITIGDEVGTMIINPSATTSYPISIGGTMTDSGEVRVAIIDQVTVSASVDTSLTFTVSGVAAGATVNNSPTTTAATTSPTALPFGSLGLSTSKTLAHDLSVATNATNGYTVTVEQTQDLQSSTGATIDGFIDGNYTVTPSAWQGPAADVEDDTTFGHWGLTSEDGTTTRSAEFGSDEWVSASTTPVIIMSHDDPADGLTQGIGLARIGYQIEISSLQEAGDDYNTTLRYIVTPTF